MSNDLEKFLQQAAERLAQKANASGRTAPTRPNQPARPNRSQGNRPKQARPPVAQVVEAEVVDSDPASQRRLRELGPDPLSTIDTRPALAQDISQADERMLSHVHGVFDHEIGNIRSGSSSLKSSRQVSQTEQTIEVNRRAETVSPLIKVLSNPDSLRAAFIVGEIFNRRTF